MRAIIGCEESQTITIALRELGYEAYSCDLIPCSGGHPEWHFQEDIFEVLKREKFHLGIFHPPCTYLCVSGIRWLNDKRFPQRKQQQKEAIDFFMKCINTDIEYTAVENPIGVMSSIYREPDQIIQPYRFNEPASKATCLWLKNLPPLISFSRTKLEYVTTKSGKTWEKWFFDNSCVKGKEERSKARSKTFNGIGKAMAEKYTQLQELRRTRDKPEILAQREANLLEREKSVRVIELTLSQKQTILDQREQLMQNKILKVNEDCANQVMDAKTKVKEYQDLLNTVTAELTKRKVILDKLEERINEYPTLIEPYINQVKKLIALTNGASTRNYYAAERTKGVESDRYTKYANAGFSLSEKLKQFITWLNA